jgi:hypothetical protein
VRAIPASEALSLYSDKFFIRWNFARDRAQKTAYFIAPHSFRTTLGSRTKQHGKNNSKLRHIAIFML